MPRVQQHMGSTLSGHPPSADRAHVRWSRWGTGKCATAFLMMALLAAGIGLDGCGATSGHDPAGKATTVSASQGKEVEAYARKELDRLKSAWGPTLARVGLPGGDVITILALRCGTTETSCYRLAEAWEGPPRYAHARHGQNRRTAKRTVGTGGPAITDGGPGERAVALDMGVAHGCAGLRPHEYPYALAYGVLRGVEDVVTDRANGRTVRMKKAAIPARIRPEGVLLYGLLLPGSNEIVVRAPGGRIVERQDWAGSNKAVSSSCGGSTGGPAQ